VTLLRYRSNNQFRKCRLKLGPGIAGGAPGINAVLEGDLPGGHDLVVLANLDPPAMFPDTLKYVTYWRKVGDTWLIAADIGNSSRPAPPPSGRR